MILDVSTYRKDIRFAVGHGYGPVRNGGPARRDVRDIRAILIHTTNGNGTNYRDEARFLQTSPDVSIHYVTSTSDATVVQVLPDEWIAWHAGDCADADYENTASLGIEIAWTPNAGMLPPVALATVDSLVRDLLARYPWITKIDTHRAQAVPRGRKIDPSGWLNDTFYRWKASLFDAPPAPVAGQPAFVRAYKVRFGARASVRRTMEVMANNANLVTLYAAGRGVDVAAIVKGQRVGGDSNWAKLADAEDRYIHMSALVEA